MDIRYVGSKGDVIDLMSDDVSAPFPEELYASEWNYVASSNIGNGEKIKRIYKSIGECDLTLEVLADTKEEFENIMEKMHDIFEYDVYNLTEGKLFCNGVYKKCFIIAKNYPNYDPLMDYVEMKLKILSGYPYWINEKTMRFGGITNEIISTEGFDYPHDYLYDYANSLTNQKIAVDGMIPSHFIMTIYGACENPAVSIGYRTYKVNVTIQTGEYLIIDTLNRKIIKVLNYGERVNVFHERDRTYTNFFEKIPAGASAVAWSGGFGFDITLLTERSEPYWK